jgi:hypothetical protein
VVKVWRRTETGEAPRRPPQRGCRAGDPGIERRDDRPAGPPVRVVHGGVRYREYLSEEQRSRRGCIARRMQPDFHHGLLTAARAENAEKSVCLRA